MKQPKESDIQKAIIDYLRLTGNDVIKFSSVGVYNARSGSYIPQSRVGVADLIFCTPTGRFGAIEVKRPGNKPTPAQLDYLAEIKKRGGIAMVAYSVDEVIGELST